MASDTEGSAEKTQCERFGFAQGCSSFIASVTREPDEGCRWANLPTVNQTPDVLRFKHVAVTANAEREEELEGVGRSKQWEGEERKGGQGRGGKGS